MAQLILASSSKYRKALLSRLPLDFDCCSSEIDESIQAGESAENLVKRLSIEKAQEVAKQYPDRFILGSDQVAVFKSQMIGKPHSFENAFKQLKEFSGQCVQFITGIALLHQQQKITNYEYSLVTVNFRTLTEKQITEYLSIDQPFDCAGSFKVEKFGVSLFESVISDDPTSLEGLPLIKVCNLLRAVGLLA